MIESILVERGIEYVASEDITSFNPGEAKQYVCIDFTTPDAFRANYRFLADNFKAVVVGTTGWNDIKDEVVSYFENAGTPMIHASNFSLGVNVMFALADKASSLLKDAGFPERSTFRRIFIIFILFMAFIIFITSLSSSVIFL